MQLKRLPVRVRRRRRVPRRRARGLPREAPPVLPRPAVRSALLRGAGQRQLLPAPEAFRGRWPRARARGAYSPGARQFRVGD